MNEQANPQIEEMRELLAALHQLPQKEREKFLYMAQGAALVSNPPPKPPEASA